MKAEFIAPFTPGPYSSPSETHREFSKVVPGYNFITPYKYGFYRIKDMLIEISQGPKFLEMEMWGVTVIKNGVKCNELCNLFHSTREWMDYLTKLENN